jgi:hypothetical protein
MEAITNQEIEAVVNENAVTNINNKNIDAIIDNDSETDTDVDSQNTLDIESLSDSDTSSEIDDMLEYPDLFFIPLWRAKKIINSGEFIMPDVDFNVCSIEELKAFEISSLFSKQLAAKSISEEDLMGIISVFSKKDLATNWVNDIILVIIKYF